jgi:catechol 2,3-dioxygenase-like lactoylglutathione lyase family enzyme
MILGIDHVGIYVRNLDSSVADIALVLGSAPSWRGTIGEYRHAWFQLSNVALDVIAPVGNGGAAQKTREYLQKHGEGIWGIGFAVRDLEGARRVLTRRGLEILEPGITHSINERGERREWRIAMTRRASTGGLTVFFVEQSSDGAAVPAPADNAVTGLDHVVINTSNPDRAAAIYGARLGLDLRLDRSNSQWGSRLQFFRCGDAIVEVGSKLNAELDGRPDHFGGLAWRVRSASSVHSRLAAAGVDVSELRQGRKPGTQVFTVRSGTANVPTLMLEATEPA